MKHLPPTLEPLQRWKQVKSSRFNGNTSEITSCKPCVPVTAPSSHCPFVPATSLSAGRGGNTRLKHHHRLPSILKCLKRATAPLCLVPDGLAEARMDRGALQHTATSSQSATVCKRTCCVVEQISLGFC